MTEHHHTATTQPENYRAHLRDEHGLTLNDSPGRGGVMSAKGLVWLHSLQHPDHEIITPSLELVLKEK